MRDKFTLTEAEESKILVDKATKVYTKSEAKTYCNRLELIGTDVMGAARNIYEELKAYTKSASGLIRNREQMMVNVNDTLHKFMLLCVEEKDAI